jgi:hypothetical protein
MRSIQFLILLLFIAMLTLSFNFFKSKPRDHADIAREIRGKVARKLSKKHQMDCIGVGGGMMDSVYMIGLTFQIYHIMDQAEARERIVDCVEEILNAINGNQEIRPYLKNYPFTTKNLQVAISVKQSDGRDVFDPDFEMVFIFESDDIDYCTVDSANTRRYKNQYRESYKEALAMVRRNLTKERAKL